MTLNTTIYVMSEADPREVTWRCRGLLDTPEGVPFVDKPCSYREGQWVVGHPPGVGLDAWLNTYYRPGEMIRATHEECDEDCWEGDECHHEMPHWFRVTFDTAYGYEGEDGRGCGALHASYVARLGEWLDARGVSWAWQNEFTGEIHIGDRYERLFDLMGQGDEARRWFEEDVKPVILRVLGAGGLSGG